MLFGSVGQRVTQHSHPVQRWSFATCRKTMGNSAGTTAAEMFDSIATLNVS